MSESEDTEENSAPEWFEKRHQVALDYPKETGLGAGRWEWVPGQQVKVDRVTVKYGPSAA